MDEIGFCNYHCEDINEETFEFKGCWNCHYLDFSENWLYVDVKEASELLDVSERTIRYWIKNGKVIGRLYIKQRRQGFLGSRIKYFITKKSIEKRKSELLRI